MTLKELLIGKPLKTEEEQIEQIGPAAGIPVLGLDALGSASHGPEAALTQRRNMVLTKSVARATEVEMKGRLFQEQSRESFLMLDFFKICDDYATRSRRRVAPQTME